MAEVILVPDSVVSKPPGAVGWNDPQDVISPGNATVYYPVVKSGRFTMSVSVEGDEQVGYFVVVRVSNEVESSEALVFSGYDLSQLPYGAVIDYLSAPVDWESVDYNETGDDDNARVNSPVGLVVTHH